MSKHLMRLYHNIEFDEVKQHTLEYGTLSGICSKCKELSVKIDMHSCPKCGTEFKYIAIQNVREHLPKMIRIIGERQGVYFIDHQDFKRIEGEQKARSLLG